MSKFGQRSAFALFELLVVAFVIALVIPLLLSLARYRAKTLPTKIRCVNNLKNVGLAMRIFATDHNDLFRWQNPEFGASTSNIARLFLSLTNELYVPQILVCNVDTRSPATNWAGFGPSNVSYFIGLNSSPEDPASLLSGDRNITLDSHQAASGQMQFRKETVAAWDQTQHRYAGNVCRGDGGIQIFNSPRLNDAMQRNVATNPTTFLFP